MSNLTTFDYKGSQISFEKGKNLMINAAQMAKTFGKQPKDWLRTTQARELISTLSASRQISLLDLVTITKGGANPGTWMHEDVALEFARWLSPLFAIWCNDRIKELLTTGVATTSNDDEAIAYAMNVLSKRLEQAKRDRELLQEQNKRLTIEIKQSASKVQYVENVLQSNQTYTSTQVAKELGMREAKQLHKLLKERNIMFRQSGQWMLTAKYCEHGYTKSRTTVYTRSDGSQGTNTITVWTEKGRAFLHTLMNR